MLCRMRLATKSTGVRVTICHNYCNVPTAINTRRLFAIAKLARPTVPTDIKGAGWLARCCIGLRIRYRLCSRSPKGFPCTARRSCLLPRWSRWVPLASGSRSCCINLSLRPACQWRCVVPHWFSPKRWRAKIPPLRLLFRCCKSDRVFKFQ